jgi:hypothetical protein
MRRSSPTPQNIGSHDRSVGQLDRQDGLPGRPSCPLSFSSTIDETATVLNGLPPVSYPPSQLRTPSKFTRHGHDR